MALALDCIMAEFYSIYTALQSSLQIIGKDENLPHSLYKSRIIVNAQI